MRTVGQLSAYLALPLIMAALLCMPSCGTLDPAGAYQGDKVLYDADVLLGTSYDTIDSFLSWELKYRGTAACPKEATQAADTLRRNSPKAFTDAWAARTAYVNARDDLTSSTLQTSLSVVRELLAISVSWTATRASTP